MDTKHLPLPTEPAIKGRVPTPWMFENMHRISREDFYNENLTEEDLKKLYPFEENR